MLGVGPEGATAAAQGPLAAAAAPAAARRGEEAHLLGMTTRVSPLRTQPASDLPMTTVPRSLNLSMTAMRNGASASRAGISVASSSSNSVGPALPVFASLYHGLRAMQRAHCQRCASAGLSVRTTAPCTSPGTPSVLLPGCEPSPERPGPVETTGPADYNKNFCTHGVYRIEINGTCGLLRVYYFLFLINYRCHRDHRSCQFINYIYNIYIIYIYRD